METVLPALGVAFAAFCVWLSVRIVNRRQRWTKWTLAIAVVVAVGYPLSLGPFNWLYFSGWISQPAMDKFSCIYAPLEVQTLPEWYRNYVAWIGQPM